jgi:hypothetical protein
MSKRIFVNRAFPFEEPYSVAKGDDLDIEFTLKNPATGEDLTTEELDNFTFVVKKQPGSHREFEDLDTLVTIIQGSMVVALPLVTVVVNVTASPEDWDPQEVGLYWCKLSGDVDGRRRTPSEFLLEVTA